MIVGFVRSVNVTNNSPSRDYSHPDDQTTQTTETPGFKPFTILINVPKLQTKELKVEKQTAPHCSTAFQRIGQTLGFCQ